MKAVLICPGERAGFDSLKESAPLVNLPILGKRLIEHWLEQMAKARAEEVTIHACDRPDDVRNITGDGSRWGLKVEVRPDLHELTISEARAKYALTTEGNVHVMDSLPGSPERPLFTNYQCWFESLTNLLKQGKVPKLVGLKEIKPGIWVGRRTRIAKDAVLHPPCWIGENVWIGSQSVVGPGAILEHRVFVAGGAEVRNSAVGPETYVGEFTYINNSLAWGSKLINWQTNSCLHVPDVFLLCGLREPRVLFSQVTWPSQIASLFVLGLTLPAGALALLKSKLEAVPALRRLVLKQEG